MAVIRGTEGNDTLNGTDADDQIFGLAGDDYINTNKGNDRVEAGDGNDTINSDEGDKTLFGGKGNDTLFGYFGNNKLYGDDGNDLLFGTYGNNTLEGGNGNDTLSGGTGNNILRGGNGNDTLNSGSGSETLDGGNGQDFLATRGSFGDKAGKITTLIGGTGTDTFEITPEYDDLNPATVGTNDYIRIKDFKTQDDFLQLEGSKSNYLLAASPAGSPQGTGIYFDKPNGQTDELIAIVENSSGLNLNNSYFTTSTNDIFSGTEIGDRFDAGEGNDEVNGRGGDDILIGGNGDDRLSGEDGNDSLSGNNGKDTLIGGKGNDSLVGGDGDDTLNGVVTPATFSSSTPDSKGQIDTLTGGAGLDKFLLGDASYYKTSKIDSYVFYDDENTTTTGTNDYALITDFNSSQDVIQLKGTATNYTLGSSPSGLPTGTGIFIDKPNTEPDELIGIVQGVNSSSLSLTAGYFSYV